MIGHSYYSLHPERSTRTFSHLILAPPCRPTGQAPTQAPHWNHERAKRATGVEIGPESVSRLSTSMVTCSFTAGQATRHSLQPMQACSSCATWGNVLCSITATLALRFNPVLNI